ncbi:peptidyl-prolyl cis-trans isomerase [Candidatus Sumerlaeota bacterium]|nr:peptidyl-prolyl cis-trans isomerase [Candidatus Sumerlaeota bacterium]
MLNALRGQRARKFTAWILVILVGIPFVFYYGWNSAPQGGGRQAVPAAEVNRTTIYRHELLPLRIDSALKIYGSPEILSLLTRQDLEEQMPDDFVVDLAIKDELLAQAAEEHGLTLGPEESRLALRAYALRRVGINPAAQVPNDVISRAIGQVAQMYGYDGEMLQRYVNHTEMRDRAARTLFYPQARTSILELWQTYEELHTEYVLEAAVIRTDAHLASGEITDEEIEAHYRDNRDQFIIGERRVYDFVVQHRDDLTGSLEITDDQIREEYETNLQAHSTPAAYELSQIFFGAGEPADVPPPQVQEALDRIASGEPFADVAADLSVDPLTREEGGYLGIRREEMLDPTVVEALSGLSAGDVTDPLLLGNQWVLYHLDDLQPAVVSPLEEVSAEIRDALRREQSDLLFNEREEEFANVRSSYTSLSDMAEGLGQEVETSEPVEPSATYIPGLGSLSQFAPELERLSVGEISEHVFVTENTLALLRLAEVREPSTRPLDDDLRRSIRQYLTERRASDIAQSIAYDLRERCLDLDQTEGELFPRALEGAPAELAESVETLTTEPFEPERNNVREIGLIPDLAQVLFYEPENSLSDVMEIRDSRGQRVAGYTLWVVRDRIEPGLTDFYDALLPLRAETIQRNQDRLIEEWYADQRRPGVNDIVRHDLTRR